MRCSLTRREHLPTAAHALKPPGQAPDVLTKTEHNTRSQDRAPATERPLDSGLAPRLLVTVAAWTVLDVPAEVRSRVWRAGEDVGRFAQRLRWPASPHTR
jgi:hypothetical protein